MKTIITALILTCTAAVLLSGGAPDALAEAVDGTWVNAIGFGDGPIFDENTNNPIVGELVEDPDSNLNFAVQEMIHSPFSEMTLVNTGDKIVFTGSVDLEGTVNSPANAGAPRTQFRFGLFKDDGDGDHIEWVGYYTQNKHGDSGNPLGAVSVKLVGNTSTYLQGAGGATLQSQAGDGTAASLFNDDTYSMNMTIERNAAGELLISSTLTGLNGYSQIINTIHATASTTGTYSFDRLGFLLGTNLATDRAAFTNLDVTFTPGDVGLLGDYNEDGTVDAADYVVWRRDDINGQQGYDDWRANFGATSPGAGGGASAVPEPATLLLVAFAVALFIAARRRPRVVLAPVRN